MSWGTIPLRHAARVVVSNVDKKSVEGQQPIRLVNYTDVYYGDTITCDDELMVATATAEQISRFRVRPGDTLITKDSETPEDIAVPAFIGSAEPDMVCGYHLALIRPNRRYHPRFLYWALSSREVREQAAVAANGLTRHGITSGAIHSLQVPSPPLEEQRRIADFLDDQTTRIDHIMEARQQQIRSVQEVELSLTSTVIVTGEPGSGVDAPRNARLKHACVDAGQYGLNISADQYKETGKRLLRTTDLTSGAVEGDGGIYVEGPLEPRFIAQKDDLLLSRSGTIGQAFLVPESLAGSAYAGFLVRFRPRPDVCAPRFIFYVTQSAQFKGSVEAEAVTSTISNFNADRYANLPIPLPELSVQRRVAGYLDRRAAQGSAGTERMQQQIRALSELRHSLISAAVSGQFDLSSADGSQVVV